jgi:drug/metabolite transporter (DMT)-like permease
MTQSSGLHFKTSVLILIMVCLAPLGNTLLGKGMKQVGAMPGWAPVELSRFFFRALTTGTIWIGIILLLAYFVAYLLVLSWADYTYVQPASSVSYVLIALLSHFMLHEEISPARWIAVAVICVGVFAVGYTQPRTPEHHSW